MGTKLKKLISIQHIPHLFQRFVKAILEQSGLKTLDPNVRATLFAEPKGFSIDPFSHKKPEYPHRNCFKDKEKKPPFTFQQLYPLYNMSDEIIFDVANQIVRENFGKQKSLYLNLIGSEWTQNEVKHVFESKDPAIFFIEYFTTHLIARRDSLLAMHAMPCYGTRCLSYTGGQKQEFHVLGLHHKLHEFQPDIHQTDDEKREDYCKRREANRPSFLHEYHNIPLNIDQPNLVSSISRVGIIPIFEDGRVAIHRPKDPNQQFLGYAHKIYEFTRGGIDLAPGETFTPKKVMQTALTELWEELGIIGKASTIKFLCDIYENNQDETKIRYFTIKVKEADFLWEKWAFDPIGKQYSDKNETKGVVVTPVKNLSRLFSLNIIDDSFTAIGDMEVLKHLVIAFNEEMNIVPIEKNVTQWTCEIPFSSFITTSFDTLEALYTDFAENKTNQIERYYEGIYKQTGSFPKQLTWDETVVMHADTTYGRQNEGYSLYGFVKILQKNYETKNDFEQEKFLNKIEEWLGQKNRRNFENKEQGLSVHFIRDFYSKNPIQKLNQDFNTPTRLPFYCSTLYAKDICAKPFSRYTTGFTLQIATPFFLIADHDIDSSEYLYVYTHLNVQERLADARTEDDMKTIVTDSFYNGDEQKFHTNFYTSVVELLNRNQGARIQDDKAYDFKWKELIACGHFGQMSGIFVDINSDLKGALMLQKNFFETFGVRLPFMVYEHNAVQAYTRTQLLEKVFEICVNNLPAKPLFQFDYSVIQFAELLNQLETKENESICKFYLNMKNKPVNNRAKIMLILHNLFEKDNELFPADDLIKTLLYDEDTEELKATLLQLKRTMHASKSLSADFIDVIRPIDEAGTYFTLYKAFQKIPDLTVEIPEDAVQKNKMRHLLYRFLYTYSEHDVDRCVAILNQIKGSLDQVKHLELAVKFSLNLKL